MILKYRFILLIQFFLSILYINLNAQKAASNLELKLDQYLEPLLEMNAWSGVIGVYQDGVPVLEKAYGWANREWKTPMSLEGKFRLASISKVFTEVAILKLAAAGRLSLDDTLQKYLPDYPFAGEVTLHQLLNHRSGIPHLNSFSNYDTLNKFSYELPQVIALFKDLPLEFKPGERYRYSNSGYVILAYIIEKVTGKSYADYLQAAIFSPLGMEHTGIDDESMLLKQRVQGYQFNAAAQLVNADYVNMDIKIGGGSLYANLADLRQFTAAIYTGRLLPESLLAELPNISGVGAAKIFSANGRVQGFCHQIIHEYNSGLTVIVLGNHYSNIALPISDAIRQLYRGAEVIPNVNYFAQQHSVPLEQLKRYEGTYDFGFGPIGLIEVRDDQLTFSNPNKPSADVLIPLGNHRFFYPQTWVVLEFVDPLPEGFKTLNWIMGEHKYPAQKK
jgi:CubicO group peptidase (beta-lactamase class C family)